MRTGYAPSGSRSTVESVAVAQAVERAGFDEVWLAEDYFERGAFAVAAALAATTERIGIGIGVVNPWTRHPVLTAMEFAAVDELSQGRAILGLGASNSRWMSDQLGLPFDRPLATLVESVELTRAVLTGAPVQHHGPHWNVEAGLSFTPFRTDPPIVLGVKGPAALTKAGAIADGVLLSVLSSPAYVRWARERVGPDCHLTGYVFLSCGPDAAAARDAARPHVAKYLGIHGDHAITRIAGLDAEDCQRFRSALLSGRPAAELVTDDLLETFTLSGDRDDCARGLRALAAAGVQTVVFIEFPGQPFERQLTEAKACLELAGLS